MDPLAELLATPVDTVLRDLIALREEKRALENREELLQRTLELMVEGNPAVAAQLEEPGYPSSPFGPLRMQIKRLMASYTFRDHAVWMPREVFQLLVEQGSSGLTIDNVRVTMRRMAQSDELIEVENLHFVLPRGLGDPQLEITLDERVPTEMALVDATGRTHRALPVADAAPRT